MISILLIYLLGALEKTAFFFLNKTKHMQEIMISITMFIMALILLIIAKIYYVNLDFSFMFDYHIYFSIFLEVMNFKLAKFNYQHQKDFTLISFAQMTSIWLIFLISYILDPILGYKDTLTINYQENYQVLLYAGLFLVSTILYFYDKLNLSNIKHPISLISFAISLTFTMYFAVKNMQTYQALLVVFIIMLTIGTVYTIENIKQKKTRRMYKKLLKRPLKITFYKYLATYIFLILLNTVVVLMISVEFLTVFKRNGQMLASNVIDYKKYKKLPSKKDMVLIFMIFSIALIIYIMQ